MDPCTAHEDPLQEGIVALASEVLAAGDLRGPLRIDWRNDSALPAAQSAALKDQFSAQLSARGLISEDPAVPVLRVTLRDTITQVVAVARFPTAQGEQVKLVQVSRTAFAAQAAPQAAPLLQKLLLWKQREPILNAVEHSAAARTLLLVLGRETLWVYASGQGQMQLQGVAHVPGTVHPSRAPDGRIYFAKDDDAHFMLELPGKTCAGTLDEKIVITCAASERPAATSKSRASPAPSSSVKLLAPCDSAQWLLSSGDGDWSKPDRLFLQDARDAGSDRVAAAEMSGPVLSLADARDGASTAIVWNLSAGEYEVYRLTLACPN